VSHEDACPCEWCERIRQNRLREPGHGHEHTINLAAKVRIGQLERLLLATDERAKRAEAEIRAKDEAIGELLELIPDGLGEGTWTRLDEPGHWWGV
jgi:hypothetical protein